MPIAEDIKTKMDQLSELDAILKKNPYNAGSLDDPIAARERGLKKDIKSFLTKHTDNLHPDISRLISEINHGSEMPATDIAVAASSEYKNMLEAYPEYLPEKNISAAIANANAQNKTNGLSSTDFENLKKTAEKYGYGLVANNVEGKAKDNIEIVKNNNSITKIPVSFSDDSICLK